MVRPALLCAALTACTGSTKPSILLITLDTTRADHLGPYGSMTAQTPTYDRLAEEGTLWTRAYSTAPLTIVSHSTIFTGRSPPSHGVRDNGDFVLSDEQVTLAERFQAAGYRTLAVTSAFPTQARWGFGQGFDTYHDPLNRPPTQLDWSDQRAADEVVDDAIELLEAQDDAPIFLWVHLFDAHWPYAPPEPYRSSFAQDPYDGEIAFASDEVGRLMQAWDEARPHSATLLTSDHGEGLGDGGEQTHGFLLHDGTVRVPMILRGHGALAAQIPAGARLDDPVGHTDIAPTLLNLAGLPVGPEIQGRDLRQGGSEAMYAEAMTPQYNLGLAPLFARTDALGRTMKGGHAAWYPAIGDAVSVTPEPREDLAQQVAALEAMQAALGEVAAQTAALGAEDLEQLQALGYIGGDPLAEAGTVDPRDVIDVIPLTWRIRQRKNPAEAEAILQILEGRMPGAWGVELLRAQQLRSTGRPEEAVQRFMDLFLRSPSATLALQTADLWRALGDPGEARSWYREALTLQPANPEAMLGEALCARMLGEDAEAEALAEGYLVDFPDHAELVLLRAELLLQQGDAAEAAEEAAWALERMPRSPMAWMIAADARWALGEADASLDLLFQALELDRGDLGVRLTLVERLWEVGRRAEARRTLRPAWRLAPDDPEIAALAVQVGLTSGSDTLPVGSVPQR